MWNSEEGPGVWPVKRSTASIETQIAGPSGFKESCLGNCIATLLDRALSMMACEVSCEYHSMVKIQSRNGKFPSICEDTYCRFLGLAGRTESNHSVRLKRRPSRPS